MSLTITLLTWKALDTGESFPITEGLTLTDLRVYGAGLIVWIKTDPQIKTTNACPFSGND